MLTFFDKNFEMIHLFNKYNLLDNNIIIKITN